MAKTLSDLVNVGALRMPKGAVPAPRLVKTPARPKLPAMGKPGAAVGHSHPIRNLGAFAHPRGGK